jgi:hypothetical protein
VRLAVFCQEYFSTIFAYAVFFWRLYEKFSPVPSVSSQILFLNTQAVVLLAASDRPAWARYAFP